MIELTTNIKELMISITIYFSYKTKAVRIIEVALDTRPPSPTHTKQADQVVGKIPHLL